MTEPTWGADRRQFMGTLVGGAVGVSAWSKTPPADAVPESPAALPPAARRAAIEWEAEQGQDKPAWDMTWVDRVQGQCRMVFDGPEVAEGTIFHQARSFLRGYTDVYGTKDGELGAVLVMRHAGIPMAVNDRLWDELELGKEFKLKDPETGKAARRNPFLQTSNPKDAKYSMIWPDGGLDTLLKRGAIGLACNMALFRIVSMIAKKQKLDNKAAREKALANLVPGVIVQPSGIFAVARAQQAGCHYIRAT